MANHALLSAIAKVPELQLSEPEAKQLAESIGGVARHYNLEASAKAVDWFNLVQCVGLIYGPRAIAIFNNRKKAQAEKSSALSATTPMAMRP